MFRSRCALLLIASLIALTGCGGGSSGDGDDTGSVDADINGLWVFLSNEPVLVEIAETDGELTSFNIMVNQTMTGPLHEDDWVSITDCTTTSSWDGRDLSIEVVRDADSEILASFTASTNSAGDIVSGSLTIGTAYEEELGAAAESQRFDTTDTGAAALFRFSNLTGNSSIRKSVALDVATDMSDLDAEAEIQVIRFTVPDPARSINFPRSPVSANGYAFFIDPDGELQGHTDLDSLEGATFEPGTHNLIIGLRPDSIGDLDSFTCNDTTTKPVLGEPHSN